MVLKTSDVVESLATIETVKTTGAESVLQSRWERIINESSKNSMQLRFVANTASVSLIWLNKLRLSLLSLQVFI